MEMVDDLACQQLVELVTDYLDGVLPETLRTSFEAHLEICAGCRLYLGQMRLTIRALRLCGGRPLPQTLEGRLLEQFRNWRTAPSD